VIEVLRIPLPKDRLRAMPKEERALFFLLGYAANQITLFSKLVTFSVNKTPSDSVEQQISYQDNKRTGPLRCRASVLCRNTGRR
jgi:hypothetical protein